jgi:hypothetical protein
MDNFDSKRKIEKVKKEIKLLLNRGLWYEYKTKQNDRCFKIRT